MGQAAKMGAMSMPTKEEIERANTRRVCTACWREQHSACNGGGCECACMAAKSRRAEGEA